MQSRIEIEIVQDDNVAIATARLSDDRGWSTPRGIVTGSSKRKAGDARDQDYGRNLAVLRALKRLGVVGHVDEGNEE